MRKIVNNIIERLSNCFGIDLHIYIKSIRENYYRLRRLNPRIRSKGLQLIDSLPKLYLECEGNCFGCNFNINLKRNKSTGLIRFHRLPFSSNSLELIETSHIIQHFSEKDLPKTLKEWWRILVVGGKLIIECPESASRFGYDCTKLKELLKDCGYGGIRQCESQDYHRLQEPCLRIETHKILKHPSQKDYYEKTWWAMKKKTRPESIEITWREKHIFNQILHELEEQLYKNKKVIDLGCGSGEMDIILGRKGHSITGIDISKKAIQLAQQHKSQENLNNIHFLDSSLENIPFPDNSFDSALMLEVLEHIDYDNVEKIFNEIKRVLKPDAKMLITVPNKFAYSDPGHIQIFTKGSLAKLLDDQNILVEQIEWETRTDAYRQHDMLKAICTNRSYPQSQHRKICALGGYSLRYDELGFHWDGQIRAFQSLGYKLLFLDSRTDTYENLKRKIIDFKPEILWVGLKGCLPFIEWMAKDLKKIGCTIVYWFCDLRGIEGVEGKMPLKEPLIDPGKLGDVIDYFFLSNAGQIEDYKKAFGMEKVFYMGRSCSPIFHRRIPLEPRYDIAFAGGTGTSIFQKKRTRLIKKISKRYNSAIRNNVKNNIAEFYSRSKIVFGADVVGEDEEFTPYLYTSNRLYVALGCGALYLCQWFPGIEKLAENHKHLVWWKTEQELFELIDHYLKHDKERETICENAQNLAHSKHTHIHRIQNMLDIIDGKTGDFYGFLK